MSKNLNYYRLILRKVSFNRELFLRELKKAYRCLNSEERVQLLNWVKFYVRGNEVLDEAISNLAF